MFAFFSESFPGRELYFSMTAGMGNEAGIGFDWGDFEKNDGIGGHHSHVPCPFPLWETLNIVAYGFMDPSYVRNVHWVLAQAMTCLHYFPQIFKNILCIYICIYKRIYIYIFIYIYIWYDMLYNVYHIKVCLYICCSIKYENI